jgi:hypothetical protein
MCIVETIKKNWSQSYGFKTYKLNARVVVGWRVFKAEKNSFSKHTGLLPDGLARRKFIHEKQSS